MSQNNIFKLNTNINIINIIMYIYAMYDADTKY